jgi:hypothetical protein
MKKRMLQYVTSLLLLHLSAFYLVVGVVVVSKSEKNLGLGASQECRMGRYLLTVLLVTIVTKHSIKQIKHNTGKGLSYCNKPLQPP